MDSHDLLLSDHESRRRARLAVFALLGIGLLLFVVASAHVCTSRNSKMNQSGNYWGRATIAGGLAQQNGHILLVPDPVAAAVAMTVFALAISASVWIGSFFATLDFDIDDVSLWAIRNAHPLGRLHAVTMVSTAFLALLAF